MVSNLIALVVFTGITLALGWLARRAWRARNALVKWVGVVLASLLTLILALFTVLGALGMYKVYGAAAGPVPNLKVAGTAEQIARGQHIARIDCAGCHSLNNDLPLSGGRNVAEDAPFPLGSFYSINLTPGGPLKDWSDGEILRTMREGVDRDGNRLIVMSANTVRFLSDEDKQAVEGVIRGTVDKYNAKDANGFFAAFTDKGLSEFLGEPGEPVEDLAAAKTEFASYIGEESVKFRSAATKVDGDKATAEVLIESQAIEGDKFVLVRSGNTWKIDGYEGGAVSIDVPDGYKTIDLTLKEFAFDFKTGDVKAGGKVAFALENKGKQRHEAVLLKVAPGVNLQQALQSESDEEPAGIEFQAFSQAKAGDSNNLVLLNGLAAGHYAFVCFFPDTDDPEETPHAFKGMVKEFDVK